MVTQITERSRYLSPLGRSNQAKIRPVGSISHFLLVPSVFAKTILSLMLDSLTIWHLCGPTNPCPLCSHPPCKGGLYFLLREQ